MGARILVVDDEDNVLRMLEYALGAKDYEVVTAETGKEALAKVAAGAPDLVILDINLPDMAGMVVCQQLRGAPETANLPVIMLSARAGVADTIHGLEVGADEYVTKPFEVDEVVARVTALLDRTRRLSQAKKKGPAKVLAFTGAKGGVGTTTVALNVASAFAADNRTVMAVELRPTFGTCALQLGQTPAEGLRGLLDLDSLNVNEHELQNRLMRCQAGLRVLFGPREGERYKEIEPDHVEAVIKGLANMADYVIVDLPPDFSAATRTAMRQCDLLVVVVESDPPCLAAGRATLELLKSSGACKGRVGAVAVNQAAAPIALKCDEIRRQLGCELFGVVPPAEEACAIAMRLGSPIVLSQNDSLAAHALSDIAKKLADVCA